MDCIVDVVAKSQTWLSDCHFHFSVKPNRFSEIIELSHGWLGFQIFFFSLSGILPVSPPVLTQLLLLVFHCLAEILNLKENLHHYLLVELSVCLNFTGILISSYNINIIVVSLLMLCFSNFPKYMRPLRVVAILLIVHRGTHIGIILKMKLSVSTHNPDTENQNSALPANFTITLSLLA